MAQTCILTDSTTQFPIPAFTGRSLVYIAPMTIDAHNDNRPVCVGRFRLGVAPGREDGARALAITLEEQPGVSHHRMRYAALQPQRNILVPVEAQALGIWVWGNGAAMLDFELRDREGEV